MNNLYREIDKLNQHAWELRVSDSQQAIELSRKAFKLAEKENYKQGLAEALRLLGFGYIRMADFETAEEYLNKSLTLFEELNDAKGLATVYEYFGIIKRNHGDAAGALGSIFKALDFSREIASAEIEVTILYQIGVTYRQLANYGKALEYLFKSLSLARSIDGNLMVGYNLNVIGSIYFETAEYTTALDYYKQGLALRKTSHDKWGEAGSLDNIGFTYLKLKDYAQAVEYCKKSLAITNTTGDKKGQANAYIHLAEALKESGDISETLRYCNESLLIRKASGDRRGEAEILLLLAEIEQKNITAQNKKKYLELLNATKTIAAEIKAPDLQSKCAYHLFEFYKNKKQFRKALPELESHIQLENGLHKETVNEKLLNLEISYKAEEAKKETEIVRQRNNELMRLNEKIEKQKMQLEQMLVELRSAQAQLIQSEKMASLGELTAGIAHEIQNPLNFVNNFSEVNDELINELVDEVDKGNTNEVKAIVKDIKQNLEKINHHGKRADAIVKGMLQHSRKSEGVKELTDINALCDEYLRLSYHGLRAKDKSFHADFKTDFDNSIAKINIVHQDIGRVLLNLFNNAFYAVNEKSKDLAGLNALPAFVPTVTVVTKKLNDKIEIKVSDNGNGIPQKIVDKIFQPFFTTKPTGQGTGLGLGLAYDIVKAHGGEIKVEAKDGEGSAFSILLPIHEIPAV